MPEKNNNNPGSQAARAGRCIGLATGPPRMQPVSSVWMDTGGFEPLLAYLNKPNPSLSKSGGNGSRFRDEFVDGRVT